MKTLDENSDFPEPILIDSNVVRFTRWNKNGSAILLKPIA
jgi:hypothetical protein